MQCRQAPSSKFELILSKYAKLDCLKVYSCRGACAQMENNCDGVSAIRMLTSRKYMNELHVIPTGTPTNPTDLYAVIVVR